MHFSHAIPAVAALILGAGGAAFAAPPATGIIVRGAALRDLVANMELSDEAHYSYVFVADGTFSGTEMGRDIRGAWRIDKHGLCMKWSKPPGAEECFVERRNHNELSLFRTGLEAWYGKMRPAASKTLNNN